MDDQAKEELVKLHEQLGNFEIFLGMMMMPIRPTQDEREAITAVNYLIERLVEEYKNQKIRQSKMHLS